MNSLLSTLLLICGIAAAAPDTEAIYAVTPQHDVVQLPGRAFVSQGNKIYGASISRQKPDTVTISEIEVTPGELARPREVYTFTNTLPSLPEETGIPSHTDSHGRQTLGCLNPDAGNFYIFDLRDKSRIRQVLSGKTALPEGYVVDRCSAIAYGDRIVVYLVNEQKAAFGFLNVRTGALEQPLYPAEYCYPRSIIWQGDNTIWSFSVGRRAMIYTAYDLNKKANVLDGTLSSAFDIVAPVQNDLYLLKYDGDFQLLDTAKEKLPAAHTPKPRPSALYGISEEAGDTLITVPAEVYTVHDSTAYLYAGSAVYAVERIAPNRTHWEKVYTPAEHQGILYSYGAHKHPPLSISQINGGDLYLVETGAHPTSRRITNMPDGYSLNQCTPLPRDGKILLKLDNKAEGKSCYAIMDEATAAIFSPLYETEPGEALSLIWRGGDLVYEVVKNSPKWDLSVRLYNLREQKIVSRISSDDIYRLFVFGRELCYLTLHDILHPLSPEENP